MKKFLLEVMKKSNDFVLLYGGEVLSWSSDADVLFYEKAELITRRSVRYPELLEIYFRGVPWIFDKELDFKLASLVLVYYRLGSRYAWRELHKLQNKGVICCG